jgi:regulator of replication initiation timing
MNNLTLLSGLADIQDIQDFRLRDFMSKMGLDSRQPSTFYRTLLKESRDAIRLIGYLQNQSNALENAMCELETELSTQERQIEDFRAKLSRLQNETQSRIIELESKNQQLKTTASELLETAENYEAMKDLLKGRVGEDELRALYDLVSAIYRKAIFAGIGGKRELDATDLERLAPIRQRLREELMTVLQIPRDLLEERLIKAEKANEAFKPLVNQMFGRKG